MFSTIQEAIDALKRGDMIVVVDDIHRENEGDFVMAAEKVTPSSINTMIREGGGLICVPLEEDRAEKLNLPRMVDASTDPLRTAFTVSVDAIETGTGISAKERARTIQQLANPSSTASSFKRPGHMFPLVGKQGGVLVRPGHTEAAIDLCKLAKLQPVGVICEILNPDGTMARRDDLAFLAQQKHYVMISIEQLITFLKEAHHA
jgi:3,4-dihydroxy 2-butanone 4-phosphate synthase / GTP cyclohydrolase II